MKIASGAGSSADGGKGVGERRFEHYGTVEVFHEGTGLAHLPEPARLQVYRTLTAGAPQRVDPVDEAGVAKFTRNPVGVELVAEWGPDAPKNNRGGVAAGES